MLIRWQRTKWYLASTYKNYKHAIQVPELIAKVEKGNSELWLLGRRFTVKNTNGNETIRQLHNFLSNMKRITYVDRFTSRGRVLSDTDWGCTIRAGQMLFCNALIHKLDYTIQSHKDSDPLYQLFINNNRLAIQSFIESIEDRKEAKSGDRWAADRFTYTLKLLIESTQDQTVTNLTSSQRQLTTCHLSSNIQPSLGILNLNGYIRCSKLKTLLKTYRHLLVFVHLGINDEKIDLNSKKFLHEVMKLSSFGGFMGSKGAEAYYIFGNDGELFYYLDPHEIVREKDLNLPKAFQVTAVSQIKYSELEHAVTICFVVTESNIQEFHSDLQRLSDQYQVIGVFGFDQPEETLPDSLENISAYEINAEFLKTFQEKHPPVQPQTQLPKTARYLHGFFVQSTIIEDSYKETS